MHSLKRIRTMWFGSVNNYSHVGHLNLTASSHSDKMTPTGGQDGRFATRLSEASLLG